MGSSRIRSTGTNFHQTWAEIHLNIVKLLKVRLIHLIRLNKKKTSRVDASMQVLMSQVCLGVLFSLFISKYSEYFQLTLRPGLLSAHLYSSL